MCDLHIANPQRPKNTCLVTVSPTLIWYIWLNISKGTSCQKTWFWVTEVQSQNTSNLVPRLILRFHMFFQSSIFILQVAWRIKDVNAVSSCKMDVLNACMYVLCTDSQTCKSLCLEINFFINLLHCLQWNYHILRKQCPISTIFAQKLSSKNTHLNTKKSILNFWPNWSL